MAAIVRVLEDSALAAELGAGRRVHVREQFLLPRILRAELRVLVRLEALATPAPRAHARR